MEERIKELEGHVQRLRNIVWVVGVLGVIFGVSGGWGISTLQDSKDQIKELEENVAALKGNTTEIEKLFDNARISQENKFDQHVLNKRTELDTHINDTAKSIKTHEKTVKSLKSEVAFIKGAYPKYGSKVRLRNESYKRCMDLRSQNQSTLQLKTCKGPSVKEQSWVLDKR